MNDKKVAILTFHSAINYGAVLQCFALQTKLKKLNYDVRILNYQSAYFKSLYSLNPFVKKSKKDVLRQLYHWGFRPIRTFNLFVKSRRFRKFVKNKLLLSKKYYLDNISDANCEFEYFIVGSDQVWNSRLSNYDSTYFLDFVTKARISYAASLGKNTITGFEYENLSKELPKYNAISLRELEGTRIIKKYLGIDSKQVLDPTLLLNKEEWFGYLSHRSYKKKYLLIYLVQYPQILIDKAFEYAEKHKLKVISFNYLKTKKKYKFVSTQGPLGLLEYIKNAEIIFTTSFHGLIYSINFNKEFYYELSNKVVNMNARLIDICNSLNIFDRNIADASLNEPQLNYEEINKRVDELRKESIDFLMNSLGGMR